MCIYVEIDHKMIMTAIINMLHDQIVQIIYKGGECLSIVDPISFDEVR